MKSNNVCRVYALRIVFGITLLVLLLAGGTGATPVEEWNKTYGGWSDDEAWSVQQTTDNGYILAGGADSYGTGGIWLIKTDVNGIEQWNKTFVWYDGYGGTPSNGRATSVEQTIDGGYVIIGSMSQNCGSSSCVYGFIIKTDANGNKQCDNRFSGGVASVQQTTDGSYIIAGGIGSNVYPNHYVWLLKINPDCTKQWSQEIGGGGSEGGVSVQQASDGGYIIAGSISSQTDSNALLVKTDADGIVKWQRIFGGTKADKASSAQESPAGQFNVSIKLQ